MTRAGDNTKIVLTGDSFQIDNPYVDSANNGLVYLVDRFKEEPISNILVYTFLVQKADSVFKTAFITAGKQMKHV